jgi:hypothetical protein
MNGPRLMPPYPSEAPAPGFHWKFDWGAWTWVHQEKWWASWPKYPPEWGGKVPEEYQ